MSDKTEALDIIETKIRELERCIHGEKAPPSENFNPVIDSLVQANTLMTAALSGREKFTSIFKRLNELDHHLDVNQLSEDPKVLEAKLNVIIDMQQEVEESLVAMEELNKLKSVLDDNAIKETQALKKDLTALTDVHLTKKEKLDQINGEVLDVLANFNETCLDISKTFILLNDAITKLEIENAPKKTKPE